jgi:hypothetical protein
MQIDINALARLGAQRRLDSIVEEMAAIQQWLGHTEERQHSGGGISVTLDPQADDERVRTKNGNYVTRRAYASMVENAKRARAAKRRQKLAQARVHRQSEVH